MSTNLYPHNMLINSKYKKIFITGGAGFIGSHLTDILVNEDREVIVYDNLSTGKKEFLINCFKKNNFKFIKADLLNNQLLSKSIPNDTDMVIHLAANADVSKGYADPSLDFKQTTIATFNLLEAMRQKKIKNLVYFSGSGVYGDVGKRFTNEKYGPLVPVSMYGATKLSAEALIYSFSNLYGIKAWILRPANIIGNRSTHGVIFDFINSLKINPKKLAILGDGNQSKSYLHISDLMSALFCILNKGNNSINVYNVSSDSFITVNSIAKIVIKIMKLKNVEIITTAEKIGWPGDIPMVRLDISKISKDRWKPLLTSRLAIERTVREIIAERDTK